MVGIIGTLALAFGSAWVSGINLYAMVATLGLLGRFGGLKLPGELGVVMNGWVIGVAVFLYCVEFIADKIPIVDSVWNIAHTFIRVPAGAVVAAVSLGDFDRSVQVIAFMVGGGLALSSHGTTAAIRVALNLSPEPITNIIASLVEDVVAIVVLVLAILAPILVLFMLVVFVIVTIWLLPKIVRLTARSFARAKAAFKRLRPVAN